jgi:glucose/arabinose dehydrogenase
MDAHMAPMDILFWNNQNWSGISSGDAFVSFHGSWNRQPPMGYRVDHITYNAGFPVSYSPFLGYEGPGVFSSKYVKLTLLLCHS